MNSTIKKQFDLNGKVAIITGASKGIGESIARGLAEFGAKVIISSRNQASVDAVADSLIAAGYEAKAFACHVGDESQLKNLVDQTMKTYGRIDILINNAAINPVYGPIQETTNEVFDKIININLKACFSLANLCYPYLKIAGGSIINISSVEGMKPGSGLGIYGVSKAALIMLTKSQAKEWGAAGIRSNVICPGLIKTKFSAALWNNEDILNRITKLIPSSRMAVPDELAGLAVFLASNASSYCTGSVYTIDGGLMIS